jgi:hypothetical protein
MPLELLKKKKNAIGKAGCSWGFNQNECWIPPDWDICGIYLSC